MQTSRSVRDKSRETFYLRLGHSKISHLWRNKGISLPTYITPVDLISYVLIAHMGNVLIFLNETSYWEGLLIRKWCVSLCFQIIFISASELLDQNVIALIEGSLNKTSACALSEVTGIPLIRLHGNSSPIDQCKNAIQMSPGYKDYAHATIDILNKFGWKNIALVADGKMDITYFAKLWRILTILLTRPNGPPPPPHPCNSQNI